MAARIAFAFLSLHAEIFPMATLFPRRCRFRHRRVLRRDPRFFRRRTIGGFIGSTIGSVVDS